MDAWFLFILVALLPVSLSEAAPIPTAVHGLNATDLQAAVTDMRSKSFYGFSLLLQMLNATAVSYRSLTFLVPADSQLTETHISADQIDEFVISHAIPTTLVFNDIMHFPTGSLIPSGAENKMMRITNRGRSNFFVNNAHIVTPNVCQNSYIKCHGIDAVIQYDNGNGSYVTTGE